MKTSKILFSTAYFAFLLLGSGVTFAGTATSDYAVQEQLERQYSEKIKNIYPDGKFAVSVSLAPLSRVDLDLSNYNVQVREEDADPRARVTQVKIVADAEIPAHLISSVIGIKEALIKVEVQSFEGIKRSIASVAPGTPAETKAENSSPGVLGKFGGLALLIFAGIFAVGLFFVRSITRSLTELVAKADQMVSAPPPVSVEYIDKTISSRNDRGGGSGSGGESQRMGTTARSSDYSDGQLKAFFSECYWTQNDEGASALIRQIPKMKIYQELSFGKEYISYLKGITPGGLSFLKDPYFLQPDETFYELAVEETPKTWFRSVSEMRLEKLGLTAFETLQTVEEVPSHRGQSSKKRHLKSQVRVHIRSVAEEAELLEKLTSEEQKLELPSLYKLTQLTDDELVRVFEGITAKELAEAWVGPDSILNALQSKIPERKWELAKSILESDKAKAPRASRESAGFKKLMQLFNEVQASRLTIKDAA